MFMRPGGRRTGTPGRGASERHGYPVAMGTRRSHGIVAVVIAGLVLLGVLYIAHVLLLFAGATEGDVPEASRLHLPAGADVIGQAHDCASGGCWVTLSVRPPDGRTPEDLAADTGATPRSSSSRETCSIRGRYGCGASGHRVRRSVWTIGRRSTSRRARALGAFKLLAVASWHGCGISRALDIGFAVPAQATLRKWRYIIRSSRRTTSEDG